MVNEKPYAERLEDARDACKENAAATVVDKFGRKATQAMDFNTYLSECTTEELDQAGYFADEHRVSRRDLLDRMGLGGEN